VQEVARYAAFSDPMHAYISAKGKFACRPGGGFRKEYFLELHRECPVFPVIPLFSGIIDALPPTEYFLLSTNRQGQETLLISDGKQYLHDAIISIDKQ